MSDAFAEPKDSFGAEAQARRQISIGNRLAGEQSLYLRQHAGNPVDWYPWGEEAFDRARAEDKLVFLSIGYSSCHWCHVMEREVFADQQLAAQLNASFISIKVDREEQPDVDAVYMEAMRLMTGQGGWPLNMFLTADKLPFYGVTYLPPEQFSLLLTGVLQAQHTEPDKLLNAGAELRERIATEIAAETGSAVTMDEVAQAVDQAELNFDEEWGGFGTAQKFPVPARWRFLLHYFRGNGDDYLADRIRLTLDRMADGGLFDQLGGGFHRYTVEPTWLVPHFEKMLYDNAQLAALYTEASVVLDDEQYARVARATLDFLLAEMSSPAGAFYASFDADSGDEEGSYYVWTPADLVEVAGAEDGRALAQVLGVTEAGNFEGANVLTRRSGNGENEDEDVLDTATAEALLARWRQPLLDYRNRRPKPGLDPKVVTAWNGLAIAALAQSAGVFAEPRYSEAATRCADYLWQYHRAADGALLRAGTGGAATGPAVLDDYAALAYGLLELYNTTGELTQLERALALIDYARAHFPHPEAGFYFTAAEVAAPLGRQVEIYDSVEPSGNALLLLAIQRAAALTHNLEYKRTVKQALDYYSGAMRRAGLEMAVWYDLALLELNPYYTVVIAADAPDEQSAVLLEIARQLAMPYAAIVAKPAQDAAALAELIPSADERTAMDGDPTAYVCQSGSCREPTSDPAELAYQLTGDWRF